MHKSKLKQLSLAVCLALMPIYGYSAGLGKLNVISGLGEPIKAEIELLALTPDELSSLSATVAPEEAYAIQGIPRLSVHNNIKVELAKAADGSPILKLNSVQPISDPYLDMLIQVDWSSGRLLREYTILLDPPEYKTTISDAVAAPASIINKPTSSASNDADIDSQAVTSGTVKSKKVKPTTKKATSTQDSEVSDTSVETTQVTTQRGDSLAAIARDVKLEGVSLDQMLVGLFEANKHAFVDGNMNRLKVGQILKVPSKETLIATDSKQASQEVKLHSSNWNVYRNSLAGNVAAADVEEQNQTKQSSAGKISSAEDLAAAKKAGPQDVVKLSAGGKQVGKEGAAYDAKVLALQEEATAKEKALKEAQERTSALEAQIADMQKLLALKNQAMANAQKSAKAQTGVAPKAEVDSKASAQSKSTAELQPQQTPPAATATESKPEPTQPADAPVAAAKPVEKPVVNVPAAKPADNKQAAKSNKPAVATTPVAEEEPLDLFDSIFAGIDFMLLAAAGGLALLVAGWAYLRNKRRRDLDSFERGILTSGGLSANTVFGNTTGSASTSDTSFLTDFAQSADGSMIDTNDVDPIAEAEVYMAYGRDAQAEEILKDAITKEPKRYELHLKLLEMYAARKDISAFEAIAGELYTTLGSDNPTWAKVAELGVTVEPDNPLYDLSQIATMPASASSSEPSEASSSDNLASAIDKELDWEKELDLDKELAFTTDFSSKVTEPSATPNVVDTSSVSGDANGVVTQFGNLNGAFTQEQGASLAMNTAEPQNTMNDGLNAEMALFSEMAEVSPDVSAEAPKPAIASVETNAPELPASASQHDANAEADNSLNFDFSELGKFTLDGNDSSDTAVDANVASVEPVDFVPTFANSEVMGAETSNTEIAQNSPSAEIESANPGAEMNALNFDVEGLSQEAAPTIDTDAAIPSTSVESAPSLSFEAVDFDAAESDALLDETSLMQAEDAPLPDLSGISLDLTNEFGSENAGSDEIQFDLPAVEDTIEIAAPQDVADAPATSDFDLASINLNLSEDAGMSSTVEAAEVAPAQVDVNEDPDVDIKLDLVKVYIDMEDIEGARDLLDEVMKEGGPQQRQTAEQLLASLV